MIQISPEKLKTLIDENPSVTMIDVREQWEFDTCHINGSHHIGMESISEKLPEFDREDSIVIICHHGMRSFQVAQYLELEGFEKVMNLEGGIDAWAKKVDNNMTQY